MTEDEMIASGQALFKKCYGDIIPVPVVVDPKVFTGMTMKMFHDFWGDDRLSFREKRLIIMGAIAGMGADPALFEIHAKSALNNGEIDASELRAFILMVLPYVGYPRTTPLHMVTEKLLAERAKQASA